MWLLQRDSKLGQQANIRDSNAIVIGSGISGLAAAAMLTYHFKHVHLFERDIIPYEKFIETTNINEISTYRKGVPQGRHSHALLVRGLSNLNKLFINFANRLKSKGGIEVHMLEHLDFRIFGKSIPQPQNPKDNPIVYFQSRPFLESVLRILLKEQYPTIQFHSGTVVKGLLSSKPGSITGITYYIKQQAAEKQTMMDDSSSRDSDTGIDTGGSLKYRKKLLMEMEASLVVDCSGSSTKIDTWLSQLKMSAIPVDKIDAYCGYTSFVVKNALEGLSIRGPNTETKAVYSMLEPMSPNTRGFYCGPTGLSNEFVITLLGVNKDYPPSHPNVTFNDCKEWIKQNSNTDIPNMIFENTKLIKEEDESLEFSMYRPKGNIWRHCERWEGCPDGLVILGDAQCCFSPIYGNGMTNATIHVSELDAQLRKQFQLFSNGQLTGLSKRFYQNCAIFNSVPFLLESTLNLAYPQTVSKYHSHPILPSFVLRPTILFLYHFIQLALQDSNIAQYFINLNNLTISPLQILAPKIFLRILWNCLTLPAPPCLNSKEQVDK